MKLGTRVILVVMSATVVIAGTLIVSAQLANEKAEERFVDATITGKTVLWQKIISSELDHMQSNSRSLKRDRDTLSALKFSDQEALQENAITTYNLLSSSDIISRMQITDLSGNVLFSAPNTFNGKSVKKSIRQAKEEGREIRGLERDDDGKLVTVFAFPLFNRGKPIGIGVFMRELQPAIEDFKENDQSENYIVDGNDQMEYATNTGLLGSMDITFPELGTRDFNVIEAIDMANAVVIQPIYSVAGKPVAHLVSITDRTQSYLAEKQIKQSAYTITGFILLAAVLGLFLYLRHLLGPLGKVSRAMSEIAGGDGDLTQRLHASGTAEVAEVAAAFNKFAEKIQNVIIKIRHDVDSIASRSQGIAEGNVDLSRRTENQASSLTETTSSMSNMTDKVQENANSAKEANQLAMKAAESCKEGAISVTETIGAVSQIEASSSKMVNIVNLMDEIAFQTNLLAINASIEAAHAGEHGKGFAVVATEVRALAQRSANSAREIGVLVKDNLEKTKTGTELVEKSGEALAEIVSNINSVTDIVNLISDASNEQAAGINQINDAVANMQDMTQKNSSLVVQISNASADMENMAKELNELLAYFKVYSQDVNIVTEIQHTENEHVPAIPATLDTKFA